MGTVAFCSFKPENLPGSLHNEGTNVPFSSTALSYNQAPSCTSMVLQRQLMPLSDSKPYVMQPCMHIYRSLACLKLEVQSSSAWAYWDTDTEILKTRSLALPTVVRSYRKHCTDASLVTGSDQGNQAFGDLMHFPESVFDICT